MSVLRELLKATVEQGASDLHIKTGAVPIYRINGSLVRSKTEALSVGEVERLVEQMLPPHLKESFRSDHEADFSLFEEDIGRFRVNVFLGKGELNLVLRHVKSKIPNFEELHLPDQLRRIAMTPRGIVLASGTTGSGKSTSLAAMINHVNQHKKARIITIEDPIEYTFSDNLSLISQREVGIDTTTFDAALKRVLRQDPDIIMIGEMRDAESFMAALTASETGHLIFSTLHTGSAAQTISRILDMFPSNERDQVRMSLADNLKAVFCQRLIPAVRGGVVPAVEIMISSSTVRKIIEKNMLDKLEAAIETGRDDGMQSFNQHIYQLITSGAITEAEGMQRASNPEALRMNLKGIFLDEDSRILDI